MACGAPVVASAVGGIPEVVDDGTTGFLVHFETDGSAMGAPRDKQAFAKGLAEQINRLVDDAVLAKQMGAAGRSRVEAMFSWSAIATQTAELYQRLCAAR